MARGIIPSESSEQRALLQWWATFAASKGIDERLLFSIPNAQKFLSKANNIHAAYSTVWKEGMRPGVPDVFLAMSRMHKDGSLMFPGLFIEMKRKGQSVKKGSDQEAMISLLRRTGWNVCVCQGADEAIRAIKAYLGGVSVSNVTKERRCYT